MACWFGLGVRSRRGLGLFAYPGEEFDIAVGALDGGGHEALPLEVGLRLDPSLDALAGSLVGGGVANDAARANVFAGEFELRFDEDDGVASGFENGEGWGKDEGEGDEGDVGDDDVHEFRDIVWGHVADIEVFATDDAGVITQFPDQLISADIVSVDARGAMLEEAVGEAAGGGSDIESDQAGDVDLEVV